MVPVLNPHIQLSIVIQQIAAIYRERTPRCLYISCHLYQRDDCRNQKIHCSSYSDPCQASLHTPLLSALWKAETHSLHNEREFFEMYPRPNHPHAKLISTLQINCLEVCNLSSSLATLRTI
jgi:hypothetical protein